MLRSFRFANHKSFRDEAELLLMPTYDKSGPAVPVAGVFGANASGKSNLLDALRWMQAAVRESYANWEPGAGVPRSPFRLDPDARAEPSLYSVEIVLGGQRYAYGLRVASDRVLEEWLYTYPRNRRRVIFEREQKSIRLGSTLPDYRTRSESLGQLTRENALFLSVAAHNDLASVQPVYDWFRAQVFYADGTGLVNDELSRRLRDPKTRSSFVSLLGAADLGISDITVEDGSNRAEIERTVRAMIDGQTLQRIMESRQELQAMQLALALQEANPAFGEGLLEQVRELLAESVADRLGLDPSGLRLYHGKSRVPLALEDQSAGTRSWIGLVSASLETIGVGGLMIVDEVDASLHPHLTARLINLFRDPEASGKNAQLLFTTHDATLLDEDILSRDEVWFVEKNLESGASRLYPLTDFHPRKREDRVGRYLAGSYGAIPVVSNSRFREAVQGTDHAAAA